MKGPRSREKERERGRRERGLHHISERGQRGESTKTPWMAIHCFSTKTNPVLLSPSTDVVVDVALDGPSSSS